MQNYIQVRKNNRINRGLFISSSEIGECKKCGKKRKIHSKGMCYTCYAPNKNCKICGNLGKLRTGLCDRCYRKKNYMGVCRNCTRKTVLKNFSEKLCGSCYNSKHYKGKCSVCGEEKVLNGNKCPACWIKQNKKGTCSSCKRSDVLLNGEHSLCSNCYKNRNNTGKCKKCENNGVLTEGLCETCYKKNNYYGFCSSCGANAILAEGLCPRCQKGKDDLGFCKQCEKKAVLNQDKLCKPCEEKEDNISICLVCGKKKPLINNKVCADCYEEKASGVKHQMRASLGHVLAKILGKDNVRKFEKEMFFKGYDEPFKPDWAIRSIQGKWCPAQYFNSVQEWKREFGGSEEFRQFYQSFLQPNNYIMFTYEHNSYEKIVAYLKARGFLSTNGLPFGKKVTVDPDLYQHREELPSNLEGEFERI